MALILCIESSGKNCSVALALDGRVLTCKEQLSESFTHAEQLHVFIEDALKQGNVLPSDLHAVAVSEGPGSYTGLRIGVSAAKGMAFALQIPLVAVGTLKAMADEIRKTHPQFKVYMPMIDARRMEVYTASFSVSGDMLQSTEALVVDEKWAEALPEATVLFGDGAEKCESVGSNFTIIPNVYPSATMLMEEAEQKFQQADFADVAYFEPFYLKDFVPGISTKTIL